MKSLSTGQQPGDVVDGDRFKYAAVLVKTGALVAVHAPPLAVLPGWEERWESLPEQWQTVDGLIAAPTAELAALCGVDAATAQLWQVEALEFLRPRKCKRS